MDDLVAHLKRGELTSSLEISRRIAELLRQVVSSEKGPTGPSLLSAVKQAGLRFVEAQPRELVVGNIVRRVLRIVREESGTGAGTSSDDSDTTQSPLEVPRKRAPSLANLLEQANGSEGTEQADLRPNMLKQNVIKAINELLEELDSIRGLIAEQAVEHIHANEVIMTVGMSTSVECFLLEAAKKRTFQAVVAEGAPKLGGHKLTRKLAEESIKTTAISDSSMFAMMARVNLALASASAILANGGAVAPVGTKMLAIAARRHAVPFLLLTGLHKLSPTFADSNDVMLNQLRGPEDALPYGDGIASELFGGDTQVISPAFDYISPDLISLFVTDGGSQMPSYVYRLLNEHYDPQDYALGL